MPPLHPHIKVLRRPLESAEYTSGLSAGACRSLGAVQSMGRVGSALDDGVAESFFSTLEHKLLSRRQFATRDEARRVVFGWIGSATSTRSSGFAPAAPTSATAPACAFAGVELGAGTPG